MERVLSLAPFPQSPLATLSPRMKFQRPDPSSLHPSPGERSGSLPPSLSVDRAGQACRDLEPKLSKEYSTRPGTLAQVEAQQASNYPGALSAPGPASQQWG